MSIRLKPLHSQVIFITGATSGIGLATLRCAVEQGAKVFMTARNEDELQRIQDEMRGNGYETAFAVADVAEIDQLQFAVDSCLATFGRIDTFINNAGVSIYGRLMETNDEEAKRLFDTNFWGVVNGCKVAVGAMKHTGGAILNIGSVLSNIALPIQGLYSASKHAVKAYTDALRRELLADKSPIQVTLIMPSAIDTPYTEHAKSHIGEPIHMPPVYSARVAARAILKCAVNPTRDIGVGASAYLFPLMDRFFPNIHDRVLSKLFMEQGQSTGRALPPASHREGFETGRYPGHVMRSSLLTDIMEHKSLLKRGVVLGGVAYLLFRRFRTNAG